MKNQTQKINQKVADLQQELVPLVQEMFLQKEICFISDFYQASENGNNWTLKKNVPGKFLVESYEKNPELYFDFSKRIADDYQKVIVKYFEEHGNENGNILEEGKKKLFGNLFKWSGPIIEVGLMNHKEIVSIFQDFEKIILEKGENFFGYCCGNIIGDHVFVDYQNAPYLLGMRITIQPGKGYYDFLRSLDWIFLKSESDEENFIRIVEQIEKHSVGQDTEEMKLVFSLRAIGILGWDMLHRGDYGIGDPEQKIKCLLKFIRREY